ncbi:hypothetical protein H8788_14560 [Parabacteroides faecis]|uniref:hypothetical protein n=1 Tax=Parabacteroides TaxID=375288 RepID=UPI000EFDD750|nr:MULTISPECIES: hypothetical protein [Parabacteroides]MBC8618965.1 hypothetical protein [Parabacteroides faecis]RHS00087.1 hypothetical protein DWW23_05445 [Parabacteroides sp. AF14-59]
MNVYLVLSIVVIVVVFSYKMCFYKKGKKIWTILEEMITVCSMTFLGVILAIYFNQIEVSKTEKNNVIKYIEASEKSITDAYNDVSGFSNDISKDSDTIVYQKDRFAKRTLGYPTAFDISFNNDLLLRIISAPSVSSFSSSYERIKFMQQCVREYEGPSIGMKNTLAAYMYVLNECKNHLYNELLYQFGVIDEQDLESKNICESFPDLLNDKNWKDLYGRIMDKVKRSEFYQQRLQNEKK